MAAACVYIQRAREQQRAAGRVVHMQHTYWPPSGQMQCFPKLKWSSHECAYNCSAQDTLCQGEREGRGGGGVGREGWGRGGREGGGIQSLLQKVGVTK